jgi:co-chaperonin GroES (HSP10)
MEVDVKTGGNYVLVKPVFNDFIKLDENNKIAVIDDGSGRMSAVTGIVCQIPSKLYYEHIDMLYETEMELQFDDEVVFSKYSALAAMEENECFQDEDGFYFLVPYYQIFAFKRRGIIFTANGYLICEPIIEKTSEFTSDKANSQKAKVVIAGSLNKKYKNGDPDDEDNIKVGDIVLLDEFADLPCEYLPTFFDKPMLRIQRNLVTGIL